MNLRFRVLKPDNNIDPTTFACSNLFDVVALTSFGILIEVNGDVVFDYAIGAFNSGITFTGSVGGVDVTFAVEDVYYLKLNLDLADRDDTAEVRIKIMNNDCTTYDNVFTVNGFDLGKNPNVVLPLGMTNFTTPLNIRMMPSTWFDPGPISASYICPSAFLYRDFVTKKIHIIKNNSSIGVTEYHLPGGVIPLATGSYAEIDNEDGEITSIEIRAYNPGFKTIYTATVLVPSAPVTSPVLSFSIANPGCTTCQCFTETTEISLTTDLTSVSSYLIDDVKYLDNPQLNNNFDLIDNVTGLVVDNQNASYSPNPASPIITQPYTQPLGLDYNHQHRLVWTLRKTNAAGEILAILTIVLGPCAEEEMIRTDCGEYSWTNSQETATLEVYSYSSDGVEALVISYADITVGTTQLIPINDGVFIVKVKRNDIIEYSYKLVGICSYITCLTDNTQALVCDDPCITATTDCGCEDCGDCNCKTKDAFNLLLITYMSLLNKMYVQNPIFTELDTESAKTLKDLALVQDRLTKYCEGCS